MKTMLATAVAVAGALAAAPSFADSIPSVVVTVENSAPARGALQTPVWVGLHDGSFDIYDRNVAVGDVDANPNLISALSVEALAEDGNTGPITAEFEVAQPGRAQTTIFGTAGPLVPGESSSVTLNVDPSEDRYFSYGSMLIPSNDFFIANGNPLAHPIFDDHGRFIAEDFVVTGLEVLDAGTEVNDEIAGNTAFLNQPGPNVGLTEDGVVVLATDSATGGFIVDGTVSYPDGVLNHPVFGLADFARSPDGQGGFVPNTQYRAASVSFRYVDLGRTNLFTSRLSTDAEVIGRLQTESDARGAAIAISRNGQKVFVRILARGLTGPIQMAHLHLGAEGVNGPVVANLSDGIRGRKVSAAIDANSVVGPLADADDPDAAFVALLSEMAAGNVYINLHTAANPAGELRGQVELR